MQYNLILYDRKHVTQYGTIFHNTTQDHTIQNNAMPYKTKQNHRAQEKNIIQQHNAKQYNATQYR